MKKDPERPERGDRRAREGEAEGLTIVDADQVRITRDEFNRLHVRVGEGATHADVRPAWAFPISGEADFVSFLDGDGQEVLLMRHIEALDGESREALEAELGRIYFVPKITCIYQIEDAHGAARWEVETDRGYRVFDVRDREDVRVFRGRRVLLQDADGNRFEIEKIADLDERSRRLLDKEI